MPIRCRFGLLVVALSLLPSPAVFPALAQTVSFVDASGAPVAVYLESTRVHVRVEDPAANTSPTQVQAVGVSLTTALAGDLEFLSLDETGPDTGVFAGSMELAQAAAPFRYGVLETAIQAGPPVVRDTLTAEYAPSITDTAGMAGARIELLDERGRPAAGYTEGDWVTVRLEDHVPYNDPGVRGSVPVAVDVLAVSDEEILYLQETGNATGVYEGRIQAVLHATYDNDGIIGAPAGYLVHAQYAVTDAQETVDAEAPLVGSRAEILNAAGELADFVAESSTLRLRAIDRRTGDPGFVDTVQAEVSSEIGQDEETVTLTETVADSGVFEADVPTSIAATVPGNGRLETAEDAGPPHRFDTVTLTYAGADGGSSDTAVTYGSETLFIDASGNDARIYAAGSTVHVRVIDYNYDQSAGRDTVTAVVMSLTMGDSEVINLTETGSHTAVFEGSLPGERQPYSAVPYDGRLQAQAGETIEARHTDALAHTASADRAEIRYAVLEFLDGEGRPTQELLEGGLALVRLYSPQTNNYSYAVETTSVAVQSGLTLDTESLQVTETGPDTGVFEGSIRLAFSNGAYPFNGLLETANSGAPDYVQDTVTAEALDARATATTVGARIRFLDRFGEDAAAFALGDLVAVRLEDHNADDPQARQTLQAVVIANPETGDVEPVYVLETGYATGVFEGSIPTRPRPGVSTSSNGTLEILDGDLLQARHVWSHAPRLATDDAVVAASSVRFVDAQGRPVDSYLEASTAWVRLVFAAANSPATVDTAAVAVSAAISQDSETLALTETGADTGIFTGSIPLRTGTPAPGDGLLQTGRRTSPYLELDTLTVTHATPYGSSSDTAAMGGSRTWFVDAYGNPADSYARKSRAYVRVEDHTYDRPGLYDTVLVTVYSLTTGDQETITLQETARDGGVFAGSLPLDSVLNGTTSPYPGDGKLQADAGEEIEALHVDGTGAAPSSDRAWIDYASIELVDEAGEVTFEVLEGGVARLRVFEPYGYYSGTLSVAVESLHGADRESVTLTETSYQSHVFTGTVQLRSVPSGGGVDFNGVLETSTSGAPEYRADELTATYNGSTARAVMIPSRVWFIDGFGRVVSSFAAGERAGVRVEDHNLDGPQVRGAIEVSVRVLGGETETVTLTETGYDTNVFEGSILLSPPPYNGPGDGQLTVAAGDVLQAEHGNLTRPVASAVQAAVTEASVLFVDEDGNPADVYLEGSRAWLRVAYAGTNPADVNSIPVTLRTTLGTDVESLLLTETGPATGVFTGSIALGVSGLAPNDGVLTTVQDPGPPHEFDTLRAEYYGATDTAATSGSRTWFVDAWGNPADSYSRESRAYVRVEDHVFDRPGLYDTVQVTLRSLATGDQETLTLQETARDGGVFEGSLPLDSVISGTTYPYPGDGKLQSDAGEEIEAVHTDWTGTTFSSDRARIDYASVEFVDEAGEVAFEVLEGGVARLRVYEPYSSFSSTLTVAVESLHGADRESVTLTETSYQSHVFVGTVQLRSVAGGAGADFNGVLETSTSGAPEYRADELTASYNGSTARAVTIPSRVWFIDGFGRAVSSFALGDRAGVRVVDHNLDDPLQRRSFNVAVRSQGGDLESLTLTETGYDTNVYEGSIATGGGTPASSDGTLQVVAGETIEAEHGNATTPAKTVAQAVMAGASVLFVDADGDPAEVYLEASRAYVRVIASAPGALTVTLRTALGPDVESLILFETGPATGVFTGSIALDVSDPVPGDGVLTTVQDLGTPHEFDTLRAEYGGAADTAATIGSRTWFVDAYGNLADSYARESRAYVRVEDHTFDRPGLYDTVQVTLRSLATGDQETLTLQETARDGGVFEGSLPLDSVINGTTYPYPGDGKLQSDAEEEIEAVHTDWTGVTTSSDRALIDYASVEFVDEAGEVAFEVLEGGVARLRVYEPYSPFSSTLTVAVESLYGSDRESVTLAETSYESHVFVGTVQLRSVPGGAGVEFNGVLETSTSGAPEYRADELTAGYNGSTARAVLLPSRVWFIDGFGQVVSSFSVGERAGVRVEDHNLDDPLQRRSFGVAVRSQGGDVENVTVTETGYDTNVYEGSVATNGGTPAASDGTLQVTAGETIEAEHGNATTPAGTVAQAVMAGATVLFVEADGDPAGVYLESSRAYVRVADASASGTVTVTLRTALGADVEPLGLAETGPSSGVFTGSIPLTVSAVSPGDGRLTTVQDLGTPHEFDTLRAEYGGATDTAATISSRTSFIDSFGDPEDAYAAGSTARVRVEDHTADQPGINDTVQVTLRSLTTGDQETVTLSEVIQDGVFEGDLPLQQASAAPGDGALQSAPGEEIEAVHTDWTGATSSSDRALIRYASALFKDPTTGEGGGRVLESGQAVLQVIEISPFPAPSITAAFQSRHGGDRESVSLVYLGSGIYESTAQLYFVPPGAAVQFNGRLETSNSGSPEYLQDELTLTYQDAEGRGVTVPSRIGFFNLVEDWPTAEYAVGSLVRVRVQDQNRNDPAQVDTTTVTLSAAGDSESLTLTETWATSGIFAGELPSSANPGAPQDGTLTAGPGAVATVEHPNVHTPLPTTVALPFNGNFAPQAVNDAAETLPGQTVAIPVLANDSDPDQEPLSIGWMTSAANGNASHDGSTFSYTPDPGFVGTDTFTYVAVDPRGGQARATVTVTVLNQPPTPANDTATTIEDQAVNIAVLANDTDPNNDPLEVRAVGTPASGTAVIEPDDTITYTPEPNWSGEVTFTYMVEDAGGLTAYATVTVYVTPINDPPVANDDAVSVAEDGSTPVLVLDNDSDLENAVLDIVSVTQGASGAVTLDGFDNVAYTPNADFHGSDSFDYVISDGSGGTDTATVTVTVTPVNDPPVAVDDNATTDEDTAVTIAVLANDTDLDGDALDLLSVTAATNGTAVPNTDETVTFTPAAGFFGTATFDYSVSDGNGGSDVGTVTVTVNSVNDAPVAVDDTAATDEDSPVPVAVLANDTDPENDTLEVTAVTQGANGSVTLNPVTYTPAANWNGTDSFTYTVSDGNGGIDTATVTVTVAGTPDAPVANNDSATVAEDGSVTVNVLGNDTDADNDVLTVTAVTQGTNSTVALNPVTYTPAANFNGTDSFTYTISDGNGGTGTATVTVTVTPVNDAPVAGDDAASVVEDGSVTVNVVGNDSDVDNDILTVTAVTQGANGAVTLNPVTYTPAPNFFGTDSFTYTVSDGNGGTDTATVTVTVAPSNDALTANDDSATLAEDGSTTIAVLANDTDPENDVLTVQSVTQGTNGAVAINPDKTVTYTPNADFHGADSFTYTADDGNGGIGSATVSVTVTPVNDAPAAGDDTASVVEDGSVAVTVLGNDADVDEDLLSVASVTQGTHGSVVINPDDTVTYTPAANYNGADSFTYTISDGNGGEDTATVTLTVGAANDAPLANDDSSSTAEDNAVTVSVLGNDTDLESDTLSVSAVTQGANGEVAIAGSQVTYTPAANWNGTDSFTYTASDGNGGTDTGTVTVTVTPVNDAPVASDDPASVAEDGSVTVAVLANDTDAENDTLTVTAVTQGANGTVTLNPVTYTPDANYNGPDSFTYTISDGNGGTDTAAVNVTVGAANDAPVANDDTATLPEDGSVSIPVLGNDTDLDNDTLTVTAVTQGANGTVTLDPITYTPNANFFGSDSFTYTASDGNGGTDTATVTVTITAVNDTPVAVDDSATTLAETPVTIQVRDNDSDVDSATLTITAVTQGAHGAVAINAGQSVTYTPATAWIGPDAFTYTISDGAGGTATATVSVDVQAPPRVSADIQVLYTFDEGSGTTVNDVSGVGTPLSLTVANGSAVSWLPGALSIDANTVVQSAGAATKVINACKSSNEVTVEAWVDPVNLTQTGPAAIVTISQNATKRDVTLGQSATAYNGQLRTSTTSQGGTQLSTGAVATLNLSHVVYTRASTGAVRIYVDGTQAASGTLSGNLSTWASFNLALGAEPSGTRYWRGELHLVAIYSRALTAAEVRQNFLAGAD